MPSPQIRTILPRAATAALDELLEIFPVVVVTGARQTGKSTLVSTHPRLQRRTLLTLDDLGTKADAMADPAGFVRRESLIIDEVQRVPDLLLAIKAEVDRERQATAGRYVITGSANLLMMKQVADSLAGRAGYLFLGPMTRGEVLGHGTVGRWSELFAKQPDEWPNLLKSSKRDRDDWRECVSHGGLPFPALRLEPAARARWFTNYVNTYLERDLRDLSAIADLRQFQMLMTALALRIGNPANQTEIARDIRVPQRTISRWIDLLETSWLLTQLPAYTVNRTSRLMKRNKLYWNDAGLALHLAGGPVPSGVHLENFILADMLAWAALQAYRPEIMYWRTADNAEVDFVIEWHGRTLAVEVKATTRPGHTDWAHLRRFIAEYGDVCHGALLLHDGEETFEASDRVVVAPWWRLL